MAEIRQVEPEMLRNAAATLDNLIGQWAEAVQKITQLKEALDGMWDGLANDQFNARWEEDLNRYARLQVVLEAFRRAIQEAAEKYEAYEQEIANIVKDN